MTEPEINKEIENLPVVGPEYVLVLKSEMEVFSNQHAEYKADIKALVNVFGSFAGIIKGNMNIIKMTQVVSKIMTSETEKAKFGIIVQIIEKYTGHGQ
jgi:hypothetical protein